MTAADVPAAVRELRSAAAVRRRCTALWTAGLAGDLGHLRIHERAWPAVLDAVAAQVVATRPAGPVPIHGRLNHLRGEGWDLAADLVARAGTAQVDAVVISVLLDAGAGSRWRFEDPVTGTVRRSEGLAVAAHRALEAGVFAGDGRAYGVDAVALADLDVGRLADAFQVTADNPLVGVEGRAGLLRALGRTLVESGAGSVWELLSRDLLGGRGTGQVAQVSGEALLGWILTAFADLWPGRLDIGGFNLGDTWHHPLAGGTFPTSGVVPFHKLSQWMAYSLVEPLASLGVAVVEVEGLTGLAEYRNGGLLIDLGLLEVRGGLRADPIPPDHPLVVEWRACTVAALDHIAVHLDRHLPEERRGLGLAQILEVGTWPLGRRLAAERRPDAAPPIAVESDGTVF
ncbi:DUF1688 family protein [Euzebya sp.]|uniref:DUF1688 family protein n=1 Tax=Euzebya sp. TaxID=1971409 RepID=UPI0035159558